MSAAAPKLQKRSRLLAFGFLLMSTTHVLAIGTTPPSWEPREVVNDTLVDYASGHVTSNRILAYDHHGNPGIAYSDAVNFDLQYARRVPGVGWVSTPVVGVPSGGQYPSLAYDRYERPAISYRDISSADLKFAHFDGSTWNTEDVDTGGIVGHYTDLAFDLYGRAAIAYHDFTNSSLKYVYDTDGDFSLADETPVTVVNDYDEGVWPSLAFDPLNRPMIVHYDDTNVDLRFSVLEPGVGWVTTTIDSASGSVPYYPTLAIDPDNGYPAVAYYYPEPGDSGLRYAAWDGDEWVVEEIDPGLFVGLYPSLAFDPADGNPAISYLDYPGNDLALSWHDGSSWQFQIVDSVGDVGYASSLAFNDYGTGFPSIAYFESGTPDVLYFIEDPPAVPEPSSLVLLILGAAGVWMRHKTTLPQKHQ